MKVKNLKTSDEGVRPSSDFLEAVLQTTSNGILITGARQEIVLANGVFCSFFNLSLPAILGSNFLDLLARFDSSAEQYWLELVKKTSREGVCKNMTFTIQTAKEIKYFAVNISQFDEKRKGVESFSGERTLSGSGNMNGDGVEPGRHFVISTWRDISQSREGEDLSRRLLDLGQVLSQAINFNEALSLCVHEAMVVSGMDSGGIYLVDRLTGELELAYHEGLSDDFIKSAAFFAGKSPNTLLVMKGKPVYRQYDKVLPDTKNYVRREEGLRFIAIIPVTHEHRVIACLNIASHSREEMAAAERRALETFAVQIGGFIARLQAEEALRESEERYRTLQDNIPVGIFRSTPVGKIISANPAMARMFGCRTVEELLATPAMSFYVDQEKRVELLRQLKEKGVVTDFEVELKRKDGSTFWGSFNITGVTGKRGKIVSHDGIMEDVSERKKSAEAILRAREEWERTFDSVSEEIIILDKTFTILRANQAAARRMGISPEEAVGLTCYRAIHRMEEPPSYCPHLAMLKDEGEHSVEIHAEETGSDFLVTVSPLYNAKGKLIGAVHAARDITEQKKMDEELQKTEKLESLGLLAGGIAHDFNNILTSILVNIGLSKRDINHTEKVIDRLMEAEKAVIRAKELTKQLLTFSSGGAPVKSHASIEGLLKDTTEFALSGSNVKSRFKIADNLWDAEIDEGQISQVIQNLVMNAMQAMPAGGLLEVGAGNVKVTQEDGLAVKEGKYIRIFVKDQGLGIPREFHHKIFDPFFSTKQKGSGLGLSTAYSIVKNHNGFINLDSELGIGTTFYVYLPASGKKTSKKKVEKEALIRGHGKILLMDDEEIILDATGEMLEEMGYVVKTARDGDKAIELYQTAAAAGEPFDVVIMDLIVPGGMGGLETIKFLRSIDADVRAVVSSGYSTDPVIANYEAYGFVGAVSKPYRLEDMNAVLREAMNWKKIKP